MQVKDGVEERYTPPSQRLCLQEITATWGRLLNKEGQLLHEGGY